MASDGSNGILWSFDPPLATFYNQVIQDQQTSSIAIEFYAYHDTRETGLKSVRPEIWTDVRLVSDEEEDDGWRSIGFERMDNTHGTQPSSYQVWRLQLDLRPQSGSYGFTYRLRSEGDEEELKWLGSLGNNGTINLLTREPHDSPGRQEPHKLNGGVIHDWVQSSLIRTLERQGLTVVDPTQEDQDLKGVTTHTFTLSKTLGIAHEECLTVKHQLAIELEPDVISQTIDALVFERSQPTWYSPRPLSRFSELSSEFDTQLIIFKSASIDITKTNDDADTVMIIYPISSDSHTSVIRSTQDSPLTIISRVDKHSIDSFQLKLQIISGPYHSLREMITLIRKSDHETHKFATGDRQHQKLRYCTWNSLGPNYKLTDVMAILSDFQRSEIDHAIDSILLDDGWQDIDRSSKTLISFDASSDWTASPTSSKCHLEDAIRSIRTYSNIKKVGVWITINGYWGGINPESKFMQEYKPQNWSLIEKLDQLDVKTWHLPRSDLVYKFWDQYLSFLRSAGVDFIKIDNQASLDFLSDSTSDPIQAPHRFCSSYLSTVYDRLEHHFGLDRVLNSMSHSPTVFHTAIDQTDGHLRKKGGFRTSDDFVPNDPDFDAHRWHLISNGFNSLFAIGLGLNSDFDMFMSRHPFNDYHGSLRAFSPSPIYLTDPINQHDSTHIGRLITPLKTTKGDGYASVQSMDSIGCILPGRCLGEKAFEIHNNQSSWGLLKIGLSALDSGGGIIGIWNVKKSGGVKTAIDVLTARDLAEVMINEDSNASNEPEDVVIYSRREGSVRLLRKFMARDEIRKPNRNSESIVKEMILKENEYDLLTCSRLIKVNDHLEVANLGLIEQFVGIKGVMIIKESEQEDSTRPQVEDIEMNEEEEVLMNRSYEKSHEGKRDRSVFKIVLDGILNRLLTKDERLKIGIESKGIPTVSMKDLVRSPFRTMFIQSLTIIRIIWIWIWKIGMNKLGLMKEERRMNDGRLTLGEDSERLQKQTMMNSEKKIEKKDQKKNMERRKSEGLKQRKKGKRVLNDLKKEEMNEIRLKDQAGFETEFNTKIRFIIVFSNDDDFFLKHEKIEEEIKMNINGVQIKKEDFQRFSKFKKVEQERILNDEEEEEEEEDRDENENENENGRRKRSMMMMMILEIDLYLLDQCFECFKDDQSWRICFDD